MGFATRCCGAAMPSLANGLAFGGGFAEGGGESPSAAGAAQLLWLHLYMGTPFLKQMPHTCLKVHGLLGHSVPLL